MQIGVFSKTFVRDTLEANIDAVKSKGFECVQYNMECAGLTSMPNAIDQAHCDRIRLAMAQRQIDMAAISDHAVVRHQYQRRMLGIPKIYHHLHKALSQQ